MINEHEIERIVGGNFSRQGWDVMLEPQATSNSSYHFDLSLSIDGQLVAYVEVFTIEGNNNHHDVMDKIAHFKEAINKEMLLFFIITDGKTYDIYYKSTYLGKRFIPPSPDILQAIKNNYKGFHS